MMPSPPESLIQYFAQCYSSSFSTEDHHVLAFPAHPDSQVGLKYYNNKDVLDLALRAETYYLNHGLKPASSGNSVIGISAPGSIEWLASFIALTRLGYTILALSLRLSPEALSALLHISKCKVLVTEAAREMQLLETIPFPDPGSLYDEVPNKSTPESAPPDTAFIWHSSGTTGTPKLFPISQDAALARLMSFIASPYGKSSLFISSSAYNAAGLTFLLGALGKPPGALTFFANDRIRWTGSGLTEFLDEAKPDTTILVPAALEMIIESAGGLDVLRKLKNVVGYGAVCPSHLGNHLIHEGVRFSVGYAMSETSTLMSSASRPAIDQDWEYMSVLPPAVKYVTMRPVSVAEDAELYECIILAGLPNCPSSLSNSNDPPGSFHTSDLFVPHPTKEGRWKIVGRKDDQINMGIPVVINAIDYESVIKHSASNLVDEVVLFGQGRNKLGVLVFVKEGVTLGAAREAVWKAVEEKINGVLKIAIEKRLIVATTGKVPCTDKGNFMRTATYIHYNDLINSVY
jgi:acyl-CoA synthetase (AMP-forming)/AMP-acid ligase II